MGRQDAPGDLYPDQGSGAQWKPFGRCAHRAYRRGSSGRLGLGARVWPAADPRHAEASGRAGRGLGENWGRMPELEHDPEEWIPVFGKDHAPTRKAPRNMGAHGEKHEGPWWR